MRAPAFIVNSYMQTDTFWVENCLMELGIQVDEEPRILFQYKCPYNETHSEYTLLPTAEAQARYPYTHVQK